VLAEANRTLRTYVPPNTFATCFYAILDPQNGRLVYANAGHDLPYSWQRGGGSSELGATRMPLGLMPDMSYEEQEATVEVGDSLLFYSDGLVEAHAPDGEMFGFSRLRKLVAIHGAGSGEEFLDHLLEELYSFTGEDWEQEDDITLVALHRTATRD
jgi:serine phosphatase RsbU (regulator of sigma subunit)